MTTKFYVDVSGNYIGGFDGVDPPAGAVEVPFAPGHAQDKWNGAGYDAAQSVLDAQANAAADRGIAAMLPEAVETLMAWAEKQATGPDKSALQTMLDKFATEKAKKPAK